MAMTKARGACGDRRCHGASGAGAGGAGARVPSRDAGVTADGSPAGSPSDRSQTEPCAPGRGLATAARLFLEPQGRRRGWTLTLTRHHSRHRGASGPPGHCGHRPRKRWGPRPHPRPQRLWRSAPGSGGRQHRVHVAVGAQTACAAGRAATDKRPLSSRGPPVVRGSRRPEPQAHTDITFPTLPGDHSRAVGREENTATPRKGSEQSQVETAQGRAQHTPPRL